MRTEIIEIFTTTNIIDYDSLQNWAIVINDSWG